MITTNFKGIIPHPYYDVSDFTLVAKANILYVWDQSKHRNYVYCFDESDNKYVQLHCLDESDNQYVQLRKFKPYDRSLEFQDIYQKDADTYYMIFSNYKSYALFIYKLNLNKKEFIFEKQFKGSDAQVHSGYLIFRNKKNIQIFNLATPPRTLEKEFKNASGYTFKKYEKLSILVLSYLDDSVQEIQLTPDSIKLTRNQSPNLHSYLSHRRINQRIFERQRANDQICDHQDENRSLFLGLESIICKSSRYKLLRRCLSCRDLKWLQEPHYILRTLQKIGQEKEIYETYLFDLTTAKITPFFIGNELSLCYEAPLGRQSAYLLEIIPGAQVRIHEFKIQQE